MVQYMHHTVTVPQGDALFCRYCRYALDVDYVDIAHKLCRYMSFQPDAAGLHVQTGARGGRLGTLTEGEKEIRGRKRKKETR